MSIHTTRRHHTGFTLIELLVVVVVIGLLAAIAIVNYNNTKNKAYVAQMKSDLHNLASAEEAFFAESSMYSTDIMAINFKQSTGVTAPVIATGIGFWTATVSHAQVPGTVCGIGVNTTNPTVATAGQGEPICQ